MVGYLQAARRYGFSGFARPAPSASATLIVLVGFYTGWLGGEGIRHGHQDHVAASVTVTPT